MYDFGARNYDQALGRWMNMDALAEVYVGISPYAYTLNNPVLFIDPDGNYVDDSYIYQKYTSGKHKGEYKNPSMVKAWEIFAKSKTGSAFLGNFARKGQMIAGEKFKGESGKYDKANIDLNFERKTDDGRSSATTDNEVKGDHLQITIGIEDNPNLASNLGDFIDDIAHEAFGHVDFLAKDFYSDRNIDLSNIEKDILKNTDTWIKGDPKNRRRHRENLSHHDQEIRNKIYIKKTFPILKQYYKNANIKKTDAEIKYDVSVYPRL